MSVVTYNCVTLPYPFHTDFRQEAVYDDISRTDRILTKFDIKLQAVINFNYLSFIAPDLEGVSNNPADIMQFVRERLLKPRQKLSVKMNGSELIPPAQLGNTGTVDAMNGPQPQHCQYTLLTNTTFLLTYHIIAHYWNSPAGVPVQNQQGNDVLYNRWTETVTIDDRNYSQRTREGKFAIRSDNVGGFIADNLRTQMAVMDVPPGFLRVNSQYIQDPNGLAIRYRVVDQEVYRTPPKPAFRASGRYTESSQFPYVLHFGEAYVKLEGDKNTKQSDLVDAGVKILAQKLKLPGSKGEAIGGGTVDGLLGNNSIAVDMYDNVVELRARSWLKPGTGITGKDRRSTFWSLDYKKLTAPPNDNGGGQNFLPGYLDRGTAGIVLQAAAYFDPNLSNALNPTTGQMYQGTLVGEAGLINEGKSDCPTTGGDGPRVNPFSPDTSSPGQQIAVVSNAPVSFGDDIGEGDTNAYYSSSKPDGVWADYRIATRYENDKHVYMMPISSPNGFQPNTSPITVTVPGNPTQSSSNSTQTEPTGPTVAFVQLASPTTLLVATWTACRMNAKPDLPDPKKMADNNWVLLDEHYLPEQVFVCGDGKTPIYRISGTYVYGHSSPNSDAFKNVSYSKPPWLDDGNAITRNLESSDFTNNIIDSTNSSSSSPSLEPNATPPPPGVFGPGS